MNQNQTINVTELVMDGVEEYAEGESVKLTLVQPDEDNKLLEPQLVIEARNEGGCNCTLVDLVQVLDWLTNHEDEIRAAFPEAIDRIEKTYCL